VHEKVPRVGAEPCKRMMRIFGNPIRRTTHPRLQDADGDGGITIRGDLLSGL
jgi:hypothetical protein